MVTRQAERGAAVFIVVMVITLLTAVGVFAVRSASLADVAAGYDREGAQAALVAEYAVSASAAYMANSGLSTEIMRRYTETTRNLTSNLPKCQSNNLLTPVATGTPSLGCALLDSNDIQTSATRMGSEFVFAPANLTGSGVGATSSLNANETTSAFFTVEITDAAETGIPSAGSKATSSSWLMTLTAMSQVRPAAACAAVGGTAPAAGQQVMRAMITAESSIPNP